MATKKIAKPKLTEQEQRVLYLKATVDPLGVSSVLLRMAERGWPSVKRVNEIEFSSVDVPSLPQVEEAIDILTAIRTKLKAVG